jgi:hypothetical protein
LERYSTEPRQNPPQCTANARIGEREIISWFSVIARPVVERDSAPYRWRVREIYDCGRVADVEGDAVVDAEVMVGKTVVYTVANGKFELTVRKKRAYAVVVEGWMIVSKAEIEVGESGTIVVEHVH